MFRTATTTAALTALALALPAGAGAASNVDLSAHAEAHAVVDSAKALQMARAGADQAKAYVNRSEAEMHKAYEDTKAKGLDAAAKFGAAAHQQSAKLAALVHRSQGSLREAAAKALSQTGTWEATLVAKVGDDLQAQQGSASAQQGDTVTAVGDNQASVTTTIVVTASDAGLRDGLRKALDKTTAYALLAQARLAQAVAALRQRSADEGKKSMTAAQSSLQDAGQKVADAVSSSNEADVSFTVDGGSVRMDDLATRTMDTSASPVQGSVSGEAHVNVDGGGRR